MTDPNQYNVPTSAAGQDEPLDEGRFTQFTEGERSVLSDALRELLQVKKEAIEIANADLGSDPKSRFSEQDFGIPAIERMMEELENAP